MLTIDDNDYNNNNITTKNYIITRDFPMTVNLFPLLSRKSIPTHLPLPICTHTDHTLLTYRSFRHNSNATFNDPVKTVFHPFFRNRHL